MKKDEVQLMQWIKVEKLRLKLVKLTALAALTILVAGIIVSCASEEIGMPPPSSPSASSERVKSERRVPQVASAPSISPARRVPQVASAPSISHLTGIEIVDKIVKELKWGKIVFNTPSKMQIDDTKTIDLLLSPTKSIQQLQAELNSQDKVESAQVKVSNRMEAHLTGKGFKIEAILPEEQAVSSETTTHWQWEVTPTEGGTQKLALRLSNVITVSNQSIPYVIRAYNKTIEVQVSMQHHMKIFIKENWQWLWAAILVPVATILWTRLPRKAMKKES